MYKSLLFESDRYDTTKLSNLSDKELTKRILELSIAMNVYFTLYGVTPRKIEELHYKFCNEDHNRHFSGWKSTDGKPHNCQDNTPYELDQWKK
jgi:hypothetical protein